MPIDYSGLQNILKSNNTTLYKLNAEKVIGSATRQKLLGQLPGGIDARTIESLCKRLNCQPGDFMTYVPDSTPDETQEPQEVAHKTGESVPAFIERAVDTQAQRDEKSIRMGINPGGSGNE
jgi:putative transcriptional regulator